MDNVTLPDAKEKIKGYLDSTFQDSDNGLGGWGRIKDQTISIVNTVEALLTLDEIGALDAFLKEPRADAVKNYLYNSIQIEIARPVIKTRYLAYGIIGLEIIGDKEVKAAAVERLMLLARNGGWSSALDQNNAGLVSTFQAIFALQQIGEAVEQTHYGWLKDQHLKSNNLCSFTYGQEPNIGASCLVLYLLARGGYGDRVYTRDLANELQLQLNDMFTRMHGISEDWVSIDPQTNFRIYGYGFGLRGLHDVGVLDFKKVGIDKFVKAASLALLSAEGEQSNSALSCDPARTWVPAVLELAIALRTIHDAFDPFKVPLGGEKSLIAESQVTVERELKEIELRQAVLDAQEREILKRDNLWEQITVNQENLIEQIDKRLRTIIREILVGMALRAVLVAVWAISLILGIIYIILYSTNPQLGGAIADIVGIGALIVGGTGLISGLLYRSSKSRSNKQIEGHGETTNKRLHR